MLTDTACRPLGRGLPAGGVDAQPPWQLAAQGVLLQPFERACVPLHHALVVLSLYDDALAHMQVCCCWP